MDLYLAFVKPPRPEEKELRSHPPTMGFVQQVRRNLQALVREQHPLEMTYVPVKRVSSKLLFAEATWPSGVFLPRPLDVLPDRRTLQDVFEYETRVLLQQVQPVSADLTGALNARVSLRSLAEVARRRAEISAVLDRPSVVLPF